jgi:hypothetical protein
MFKLLLALLSLAFIPNLSFADPATPHYWVGDENGTAFVFKQDANGTVSKAPVRELDSSRSYFHWTTIEKADRWAREGIRQDEYQYLRSQGGGQAAGGGIYVSKSPINSATFGIDPLAIRIKDHARVVIAPLNFFQPTYDSQQVSTLIEGLGLDAWEYNQIGTGQAWLNLLHYDTIRSVAHLSASDLNSILAESIVGPLASQIPMLIELDRQVDFGAHAELLDQLPEAKRILAGEMNVSDEALLEAMFNQYSSNFGPLFYNTMQRQAPAPFVVGGKFSIALKKAFGKIALTKLADPQYALLLENNPFLVTSLSVVVPMAQLPCSYCRFTRNFQGSVFNGNYAPALQNPFAQTYLQSFEFVDLADMLEAQALDNGAPWTRYDNGMDRLLDRWNAASTRFQRSDAVDQLTATLDNLSELNRILSANTNAGARRAPIVAGGSHWVGQKNYYRVTLADLQVLKANPYLTLDVIEEPEAIRHGQSVLVRHEYPSARTYKRFETLLPSGTLEKLRAAEAAGILADDTNQETQNLTKQVLNDLWAGVPKTDGMKLYRAAISIHPFEDFNGRTMRLLYKLKTKHAMVFRNFDWDLLMTEAEMTWELGESATFLANLNRELSAIELKNPSYPQFYQAKTPSAYFFDSNDPAQVANPEFLNTSMNFFRNGQVQNSVREKRILEFGNLEQSDCANILSGPIQNH